MAELTDAPPPTPEENFAGNMKVLREAEGWNQSELARRITEAGLPGFHQTTVSRIEKGERPVRLGEATVIASVFRVPVERLTGDPRVLAHLASMRSAGVVVNTARLALMKAATDFDDAVRNLRIALGDPHPDDQDRGHSPWRVEWTQGDPWPAPRVIHEGYPEEWAEVAHLDARKALRAVEAANISRVVNQTSLDIVRNLDDEPPF